MILLVRKCIASLSLSRSRSVLTPTVRHYALPVQTLLFSSSTNVSVPTAEFLTTQLHISPETALKVSSTISHLKTPHRTDSVLSFLKQTGLSVPQIDHMINKYPRILNVNPEIVKKKLSVFQREGFSTPDTIAITSKIPLVLCRTSEYRIGQSITALKSVLGSTDAVCRVLKRCPWFLQRDLGKTMIPNMEFLKKRSQLSSSNVSELVMRFPRFFLRRPETLEGTARKVDNMGLEWTSKMYLHAIRMVSSMTEEKLKLKMGFFQGLGFSENEAFQMFRKCPNLVARSEKKIKESMEVMLESGGADVSLPLTNPILLMLSLEKRVKPRLELVKVLETRGLVSKKLKLSTILQISNTEFLERFMLSNTNALGDDCVIGMTKKLAL